MRASTLEQVLRRDRLVISIVLGALTLVSWAQMVLPNYVALGGERLMPVAERASTLRSRCGL